MPKQPSNRLLETSAIAIGYAMSRLDAGYLKARKCKSWKQAFQQAALALGAALALTGCATRTPWGQVDLPDTLLGTVEPGDGMPGSMFVKTSVHKQSGSGIGVVPFRLDDARQILVEVEAIGPFAGAAPVTFDAVLDTADPDAMSLSLRTARRVRPWLRQGPPRTMTSPFGATRVYAGAVLQLRMGTTTAGPVPISMDESQRDYQPVLGLAFLRNFQCVIIDWRRNELLLVSECNDAELEQRFPAESYEWSEVPLIHVGRLVEVALFSNEDTESQRGHTAESRQYELDLIGIDASIDGVSMTAIIDTGGSGEVLAFRDLPTVPGTEQAVEASSSGHVGQLVRADLASPLQIGPMQFDNLHVYRIRGDGRDQPAEGLPDIALGNTLLRRHTLWIDFERQVVRFGRFVDGGDDGS